MVVFTCNACGESLKKNRVEQHRNRRQGCNSFSCFDCNKDFLGDSFRTHNKCISEAEKYKGQFWQPKGNQNKKEQKQGEWIDVFRETIQAQTNIQPKLQEFLGDLLNFDNVPMKRQKFENFIQTALRFKPRGIMGDLMVIFDQTKEAFEKKRMANKQETAKPPPTMEEEGDPVEEQETKELNKRERKEERSKKQTKKQKNKKLVTDESTGVETSQKDEVDEEKAPQKQKHKREEQEVSLNKETTSNESEMVSEFVGKISKKKKNKKQKLDQAIDESVTINGTETLENEIDEEKSPQKKKNKREEEEELVKEETSAKGSEIVSVGKISEKKKKKKHKKLDQQIDESVTVNGTEVENCDDDVEENEKNKDIDMEETDGDTGVGKKRKYDSVATEPQYLPPEGSSSPQPKKKFKWDDVISEVLKSRSDETISMKKLRKKVLSEYLSSIEDENESYNIDKFNTKFNKKVNKNPALKVQKDKVTFAKAR